MIRLAAAVVIVVLAGACQRAEEEPMQDQQRMESTEMMGDTAGGMSDTGMMSGDTAHQM